MEVLKFFSFLVSLLIIILSSIVILLPSLGPIFDLTKVETLLKKKISALAFPIYYLFKLLEKKQLKKANRIIIISNNFIKKLKDWNISLDKIDYIPNWGNLESINYSMSKNINFLKENNLDTKKFYILYSGTLAMKHNPELIIQIAKENKDIGIIVIGVGSGFENLKNKQHLPNNIYLFPIQPFDKIDEILNSADICLGILNDDASSFSVPSKILNYLCAGKPIILSAPKDNLASKIITDSNSGKVFDTNNIQEINSYINYLKNNPEISQKIPINSRKYAVDNFNIEKISKKFKILINKMKIN